MDETKYYQVPLKTSKMDRLMKVTGTHKVKNALETAVDWALEREQKEKGAEP